MTSGLEMEWEYSGRMGRDGPQHVDTVLPPSPTAGQRGRPQSATTIGHSGAVPTVHQDNDGKARIPLHRTSHLELTVKDSSGQ